MSTDNKETEKQCDIHVVSKSLKKRKPKLMYMGRNKWNEEVWEMH